MFEPDTLLGPYRIVAQIGAGGMGQVFKAVDTRLSREVAVKVLARHLSHDSTALHRFEQEARAAGRLNHPNILAIYDTGMHDGVPYIVSELLDGQSLRARLKDGPLPPRKATDYALQLVRGLAAAHDKGIVHRDLKPENVFITRDGLVKILDFGLVKLMPHRIPGTGGAEAVDGHAPTIPPSPTEPGRIIGTVGYMAPEQVRGGSGDHRSDLFAFGVILWEMLVGRPPFHGDSAIETLNSILKDEPGDLTEIDPRIPDALERVVRHCLEKNPDERFQSARDLAFGLGAMSGLTSQVLSYRALPSFRPRLLVKPLAALLVVAALAGATYFLGTRHGVKPPATYKRLTFRSGTILSARFSPDGHAVFYGARWGGASVSVYSVRHDSPESRDLELGTSDILAVSSQGQLAISVDRRPVGYLRNTGTLATVPIVGGTPRPILHDVEAADWHPDGSGLAIVRTADGHCRLEYPIGRVLHQTLGWISHPRFSPDGKSIAFLDHPFANDDRGVVSLIRLGEREPKKISGEYQSIQGLAWTPDADEVWFAADASGTANGRSILATSPRGKARVVITSPTWLWLHDIASDGRVLVTQQSIRAGILAKVPGEPNERDLSWLDYSVIRDLSHDGRTVLFSESGEAGGTIFGVYVRKIDGSPAVKLGEGTTEALSPDGKWVLSIARDDVPAQIRMLPTGVGQPKQITSDAINHRNARWFPDGRRILFQGNVDGRPNRTWEQSIDGGAPRPITPEGVAGLLATPDGNFVLGRNEDRRFHLYPVAGGPAQPVPALLSGDVPLRFTTDGRTVFVATFGKIPAVLTRVDLTTGAREMWAEVMPADPAGLINVGPAWPTPDGRTLVYSYTRLLSDLYLVDLDRH
ncbi:MAG: protein kinase [Thermoanaerobaculia bacterium]